MSIRRVVSALAEHTEYGVIGTVGCGQGLRRISLRSV